MNYLDLISNRKPKMVIPTSPEPALPAVQEINCRGIWQDPFEIPGELIDTRPALNAFVRDILSKEVTDIVIDIETSGLNLAKDHICGIGINAIGKNIYIPIAHDNLLARQVTLVEARNALEPILDSTIVKIGHNLTFDIPFLILQGFKVSGPFTDTRLLAREFHKRDKIYYGLKQLACLHVHPRSDHWDKMLSVALKAKFNTVNKENIWRMSPEEIKPYALADVFLTRQLHAQLRLLLGARYQSPYLKLEQAALAATIEIVTGGLRIDSSLLTSGVEKLRSDLAAADRDLNNLFGVENGAYGSTKQVLRFLEDRNIFPVNPKTKKPSICVDALNLCAAKDTPEVRRLLDRKRIENQLKQFSNLPNFIANDRVYTHLQVSAQAGERYSSTSPSMYTGKKKLGAAELGVRNFITPDDNFSLVFFDFRASHFRVMAHLSGDQNMIKMLTEREDFHKGVASILWNIPYEEVSDDQRSRAKPIGFSVVYGMGPMTLANLLKIKPADARGLIDRFLGELFPKLGGLVRRVSALAKEHGHIDTGILGAKISISPEQNYIAMNYLIQATEAEILKMSVVKCHDFLKPFKSRIALPFHDELVFQIHKDEMHLIAQIKNLIEDQNLLVPFQTDVKVATKCWAEQTEWRPI